MPPIPKPADQRRNRNTPLANTQKLPAGGRRGRAPRWPGPGGADTNVRRLWRELWASPPAVMWERFGWTRVVARYVLLLLRVERLLLESDDAPVSLLAEVRQLEDRLGLSPQAMLRMRWEVADDEPERLVSGSSRSRLRAVDPGAVAGS